MKTIRKLIDLSEDCVKALSKKAIEQNTNFKQYAQQILEKEAERVKTNNHEPTNKRQP